MGAGGNREVSPCFFLSPRGDHSGARAEACPKEESEPKASDAHQLYRIRGLMMAYEMSTSRFTRTNTSARKRIPPCSTG
jgi:hypothetical protein